MSGIAELMSLETISVARKPMAGEEGDNIKNVVAHVYGLWAVHRRVIDEDMWTVTHIPTGFAIPRHVETFDEACEMVEWISTLANDFDRLASDRDFWDEFGEKFRERYDVNSGSKIPDGYKHKRLNDDLVKRVTS